MAPQGVFQCRVLECYDSWQLADLTACLVPRIWASRHSRQIKPSFTSSKHAIRSSNLFRQYCSKLFKDTQISSGCILLALYYLDQLKSSYPTLQCPFGSEFRIFTIALILSNKYLDDNTFTNKTWSEVSGIPLRELNVMEMKYLDALDYNLHVHCLRFCSWVHQCDNWFSTPTFQNPPTKRLSSADKHAFLYHQAFQKQQQQQQHQHQQSLRQYDHSNHPPTAGAIHKKRKRGLSPYHHPYFPTPPSVSVPLSAPSPLKKISKPCSSFTFPTPPMHCSSAIPLMVPHSGTTAAVNAAAYVNYYHLQHNLCYNPSSSLVQNTGYLEI
ncbi:hypothetical protein [Absidia glauca]|uniref:Cyclin-like domain-containing protein n=1 Tax=Absidia glauca TaxID=4829 RepID=A0A168KZF5_ABSGL|nr:hypothetical protein [Absidia glauca]